MEAENLKKRGGARETSVRALESFRVVVSGHPFGCVADTL